MSAVRTVSSLSKELRISTSWLYKKVELCEIPFHRFGSIIRFTEEDVAEIIKQSEQKPVASSSKGRKTEDEVSHAS
jgi:excisionase family DNA binding protein